MKYFSRKRTVKNKINRCINRNLTYNNTCFLITVLSIGILLFSCKPPKDKSIQTVKEKNNNDGRPCSCELTEKQMIEYCPVDAYGDSVVICKVGTNYVAGSGRDAMTWQEYIASDYFGGEGTLYDCRSGKKLFENLQSPHLYYKNRQLLVDKRMPLDVYDPVDGRWVEGMELPVWRTVIYAQAGVLKMKPDTLVFKPVYQDRRAFASADSEYKAEMKRTDHYLCMRTINRLLACALNGDTVSQNRLPHIEKELAAFFSNHEVYKPLLDERLQLYQAYTAYLKNGGKKEYYDLSIFPYFKQRMKMKEEK